AMLSQQDITYWTLHGLAGVATLILSALAWVVRHQLSRVGDHEERITRLEATKATHVDLETAIQRMEDTHQRVADQTNQRLDSIYQLLVTLGSQGR
ncbi:MAG: hypothetical protein ACREA0_12635, partial [bacterium]